MNNFKQSVIICTRNRPVDIVNFLESLAKQTQLPDELIVIDSSDVKLIKNKKFLSIFNTNFFSQIKLIYEHTSPGLPLQRNVGIKKATSDIIYFFDDDVILQPNYLENMNKIFDQYAEFVGGMGAVTNVPKTGKTLHKIFRQFFLLQRDNASGQFTFSGMPTHTYGVQKFKSVEVLGGCCMAFRTHILKKYMFDEKLFGYAYMEDCDITRRISYDYKLFYNPAAQLQHMASPISRDKIIDNRAMYIHNYSYLFFKNIYPKNRLKIFAYCWSVLGLFVEAFILKNKFAIKGYKKGLRQFYS